MNLYRLELKRVCKTRMTAILLAIALVLAVVMAYLPVTFIGWTELDASGNEVRYTGLKAIRKRQEQQVSGTITPDVMQEALETLSAGVPAVWCKLHQRYPGRGIL